MLLVYSDLLKRSSLTVMLYIIVKYEVLDHDSAVSELFLVDSQGTWCFPQPILLHTESTLE